MSAKDIKEFHDLDKLKNKHGGAQEECKQIKKRADQWCKDNGYQIQTRKYFYARKWTRKNEVD